MKCLDVSANNINNTIHTKRNITMSKIEISNNKVLEEQINKLSPLEQTVLSGILTYYEYKLQNKEIKEDKDNKIHNLLIEASDKMRKLLET